MIGPAKPRKAALKYIIAIVFFSIVHFQVKEEKRKEIGKIVLKYSKLVIFTTDDPRYENPLDIVNEMLNNTKKTNYIIMIDRCDAIKFALSIALKNDLVLILGKGRDNYMLIGNSKIPYSDYDTVLDLLNL